MLFNTLHAMLVKPAPLVYLHATPHTLLERVRRRGCAFEQHMPLDYLQDLQRHYDSGPPSTVTPRCSASTPTPTTSVMPHHSAAWWRS